MKNFMELFEGIKPEMCTRCFTQSMISFQVDIEIQISGAFV